MKFLFRAPPRLAFFDCAGVRLMLTAPEPESEEPPGRGRPIYFTVPDVSEAYETLKARGVEFVHEPQIIHSTDTYELWMAFFRDLDENLLAVMAEVGK